MYLSKPIPKTSFPQSVTVGRLSNEQLVPLDSSFGIIYQSKYYQSGISGAINVCYLRQSLWQLLVKVSSMLPNGYKLLIYDGWRPLEVQQALYDDYKNVLLQANPKLSARQLKRQLLQFVATPTKNVRKAPLHCTGGAVDLTLADDSDTPLDMGTEFDYFGEQAHTAYFEQSYDGICSQNADFEQKISKKRFEAVRQNRRLLYNAMASVGFTNLPTEWWHYDYGDRFWAYYKLCNQKFGGVFNLPI